jgi:hypothetical protein
VAQEGVLREDPELHRLAACHLKQNPHVNIPLRIDHSEQELEPAAVGRLGELDGVVVPGVPDVRDEVDGVPVYPTMALDVLKIMREQGAQVDYVEPDGEHPVLDLKAAEYWAPVAVFTLDALANGVGGLFTAAVLEVIGRTRAAATTLHVKVGRFRRGKTSVEWMKASGPADEVIDALEVFFRDRNS